MSDTGVLMLAFMDELEKEAALPAIFGRAGSALGKLVPSAATRRAMGHGAGTFIPVPAMAGAAIGGGAGGIKGYREARQQGAGVGQSLMYGGVRGLGGAAKGALVGAGIGAGAGMLAAKAAPREVTRLSEMITSGKGTIPALTRATQRQIHALTGWTPAGAGSLSTIKGPLSEAVAGRRAAQEALTKGRTSRIVAPGKLREAERAVAEAKARGAPVGEIAHYEDIARSMTPRSAPKRALDVVLGRSPQDVRRAHVRGLERSQGRALARETAAREAEAAGVTSLPGIARAVGRGDWRGLGAGVREQYHAMGPVGKSLMYGFPAVGMLHAATYPDVPGGPGRAERFGSAIGTLGYAAAPLTLPAAMGLGIAGEYVGGKIGKGIDVLRGARPPARRMPARPPATEPTDTGQATPTERIAGPGISEQRPEIA